MKRAVCTVLACLAVACGDKSPTGPSGGGGGGTPPSTQTRVIEIEGDMGFGDVRVGETASRTMRIWSRGNAPLTVTGIQWPGAGGWTASWTSGTIQPGQGQDVTVNYRPTSRSASSGDITIQANHTSGNNKIVTIANGVRDTFVRSGVGNTVFEFPSDMTRVRVRANPNSFCQNFVVYFGGSLVINDILGTCSVADARTYEGIHVVGVGKQVEIRSSTGVSWTFEEVR